ncbi:retrovirus-related pol polyprotein from transposon TNT 1-94 [Tanacetum coccineum]
MAIVSKSISIPNEEFLDDTTPCVARKFLNEVKSTIMTLQRVVKHKMTLEIHNWSSTAHREIHKVLKDEIFPIVNQVDARLQNFEIQFLKEAAKFVRDFKSLANEADESLDKQKTLEREIDRLLRAVVSQEIMSIVQNNSVVDTSNLQTELDRTKERFENSQLGDLKGKSKDTPCVSNTLDPLSQKLENENVELEFQVWNSEKENAHLKTTYKNLFDSISVTRAKAKTLTDSLQTQLRDSIYENVKLRAQLFDKVSEQKNTIKGTSVNTLFAKQSILGKPHSSSYKPKLYSVTPVPKTSVLPKVDKTNALINPSKTSRKDKFVPINKVRVSVRTNPTTVSPPHVITKKEVNSDSNGLSSTGVNNTAKTRRPRLRSNTKNDRVTSVSKSSCSRNKEIEVEEHHRNLLLSKKMKHMSSECNNVKLAIRNDKSKAVCAMCKQCLITANHDACVLNYVNDMNSHGKNQKPKKFLGTVRFGNDHVAEILGFGDLQWGNILITRVYFVEGLGYNLFSVGQFYDSDLECGPMRIASLNEKRYVLVIVDDYSRYTWVHFLRSKDEALEVIKTFLKRITILLQALVIIVRTDNGTEFKNQVLQEYFNMEATRTMLIFSHAPLFLWAEAITTACYTQNRSIIHRRFNKTPYELINGRNPDISFLHVFRALCYPKNDREDIGKIGAKGLDLFYAPSTIATQKPTEGDLDLLFEAIYDDYLGGQPSAAPRTVPDAQAPSVL